MANNSTALARVLDYASLLPIQAPGDLPDNLCGPLTFSILGVAITLQISALYTSLKRLAIRFSNLKNSASSRNHSIFFIIRACAFDIGLVSFVVTLTVAMISLLFMTDSMTSQVLGSRIQRTYNTMLQDWVADPNNRTIYENVLVAHDEIGYKYQTFSSLSLFFSAIGSYIYSILLLERFKNIRTIMPYPLWYNSAMLAIATFLAIVSAGAAMTKIILHSLVQQIYVQSGGIVELDAVWAQHDIVWFTVQVTRIGITTRTYAVFAVYIVALDGALSMIFYSKLNAFQKYRESLGAGRAKKDPSAAPESTGRSILSESTAGNQVESVSVQHGNTTLVQNLTIRSMWNATTTASGASGAQVKRRNTMDAKKMLSRTTIAIWGVFSASLMGALVFLVQSMVNPTFYNLGFVLNAISFFTISLHTNASYEYLECIKRIFKSTSSR